MTLSEADSERFLALLDEVEGALDEAIDDPEYRRELGVQKSEVSTWKSRRKYRQFVEAHLA